MKTFKEYFEQQETRSERIALLPGGFKPPTKGHFNALKYDLPKSNPEQIWDFTPFKSMSESINYH